MLVMKRLVLATASVLAFVSPRPALSADLGPIAPIYKPSAVPQTPFFTWTGCYVGAHVGGGLARKEFTDQASNGLVYQASDNTTSLTSFDPSGFIGGGQFGCNYQFAQEWVAGIEADIDGADVQGSKSHSFQSTVTDPGPPAKTTTTISGTNFHVKSNWLASATARLGYAPGPWLFYVKGGAAWIPDKCTITSIVTTITQTTGSPVAVNSAPPIISGASGTRAGWTFGGGIEAAFLTYWSARFDYGFYYFGKRNATFLDLTSAPAVESIKQWMSVFTFGISYRFGPGPVSTYY
jgi:outer membrane immunogenic protein